MNKSLEDLKKALDGRAKRLGNIVLSFQNLNQVHFPSGYVAHIDDKLLLIDDVLGVLDDYVVVPRQQLSEIMKKINADRKKMSTDLAWYIDIRKLIPEKELLEATTK